jgi:hypothetical protein
LLTAEQMEESVASTLKTASNWKAQGDVGRELHCVRSVLHGLLAIAATHHDTVAAGRAYLRGKHAEQLLARHHELNTTLLNTFRLNPKGARAAVDNQVTFAHMAWLLDKHALGDAIFEIVCDPQVASYWPHTKFWREYHRAIACMLARERYQPTPPPRMRGYEKHWATYLELVAALTAGDDTVPALEACTASFTRRNRDKRLNSLPFDGDGRAPVRWDVRLPSILSRWRAGGS